MKQQRTVVALLTMIAAALVMNVIVVGSRAATAQALSGPVQPTVVAGAAFHEVDGNGDPLERQYRVFRLWSDGAADMTPVVFNQPTECEVLINCPPIQFLPGSCASDITRNGDVEFNDLLNVLSDWGPCE